MTTRIPRGVATAGFSFLVAAAPIAVGADMLGGAWARLADGAALPKAGLGFIACLLIAVPDATRKR